MDMLRFIDWILKNAVYLIVGLLLAFTVFIGIRYYSLFRKPMVDAIDILPADVTLFMRFGNPGETWAKLSQRSELWQEITRIDPLRSLHQKMKRLDSVLSTEPSIKRMAAGNPLYLALAPSDGNEHDVLYIYQMPIAISESEVEQFIRKVNGEQSIILKDKTGPVTIRFVNFAEHKLPFKYFIYSNLFVGSFSEVVIRETAKRIGDGHTIASDEGLAKIMTTAGENVDANIYFHYRKSAGFLESLASTTYKPLIGNLRHFGSWTELDMIVKNDELLLNGYSWTADTSRSYLNIYRNEPRTPGVASVLPYDVTFLTVMNPDNIGQYLDGYRQYLSASDMLAEFNHDLSDFRNVLGFNPEESFLPLLGNEVAFALAGHPSEGNDRNALAVLRLMEADKAAGLLENLSQEAARKKGAPQFILEHNEYRIMKFPDGDFLSVLFGPVFAPVNQNYFTVLKEYLLMANSPEILKGILNTFYLGKTLDENYNFQSFSDNISDRSNILCYLNIRKSLPQISSFLNSGPGDFVDRNPDVVKNFEGLAVQFSYVNRMFFTNLYLKFNPEYRETNISNWECETDAPIAGQPWLIRDHRSGKLKVIVFDRMNTMYMIDHTGQVKWKIPLMEAPVSDVYQVDYYRNRKIQYLFNTTNYLYLIDLNGNYVADYPVKLPSAATNGISVFDYDKLKDYRILVACEDNRIYNFTIGGQQVDGWNKPTVNHPVKEPVEHLVSGRKDYILITDETGEVYVMNRRGERRIDPESKVKKAEYSKFYPNNTNSKGDILFTDPGGRLCYLDASGQLQTTDFGSFSGDHVFRYKDFDGDNSFDFIFLDQNFLAVFNRMKDTVMATSVESPAPGFISFFEGQNNRTVLGLVSEETGRVSLFTAEGPYDPATYITGRSPFVTGSLNNDGHLNLIICEGNKVMNYLVY